MTDGSLYLSYLSGDDNGLTLLIERYGNSLTFYINGYLHDIPESEDLMIEAFSYLVAKKPRIAEGCFKTYLYKSARNLALRQVSKQRQNRCFSFDELARDPDGETLLEEVIDTEERRRILHICMGQLSPDYCEVLHLVYFEGGLSTFFCTEII